MSVIIFHYYLSYRLDLGEVKREKQMDQVSFYLILYTE